MLRVAGIINETVNVRYDSVHAAIMILNNVDTIITNDLDDWHRLAKFYEVLARKILSEGFRTSCPKIEVVSPQHYHSWLSTLTS